MRYSYSFSVWPDEKHRHCRELFDLFRMLTARVEMNFTEPEFNRFRSQLRGEGFTLREIERVPHHEPEPVAV